MENDQCVDCVLPVVCRKCHKLFDLNRDLMRRGKTYEEILEEDCGPSEMLCWRCRDCD